MRILKPFLLALLLFTPTLADLPKPEETTHVGRRAWALRNDRVEVKVLPGGGHIVSARLLGDGPDMNPFWTPHWKSIEPNQYDPAQHGALYGDNFEGPLLASIMGHNLCLDFFGVPTEGEYEHGGITVHGEAPVTEWVVEDTWTNDEETGLRYTAELDKSALKVERVITLRAGESVFRVKESVTNMGAFDRPIGWNQHVTLGAPFVEEGVTLFDIPAYRSQVAPFDFSEKMRYEKGAEFRWPHAPGADGGEIAWRRAAAEPASSDFTAHQLDPNREHAYFTAANPKKGLMIGYIWATEDFPWVCNWEENHARTHTPWNGQETTRGMEFSTTPWTYERRQTIREGQVFDTDTYRFIDAGETLTVEYAGFLAPVAEDFRGTYDLRKRNGELVIERWSGETVRIPFGD